MLRYLRHVLLLSVLPTAAWADTCTAPSTVAFEKLVPVVRSSSGISASFPAAPKTVPQRPLNGELAIVFAEDTPGAISYFLIDASEQRCWQNSKVLEHSLRNLSRIVQRVRVTEDRNGVFMVSAGGNYEASLILAPQLLRRVTGISGDIVAGIPNRDLLFVVNRSDIGAIDALRDKVARFHSSGDHPLSDRLFLIDGANISVLDR